MTQSGAASRILIIEGETGMASFMTKGLRAEGYRTVAVGDGRSGLDQARTDWFDLLLLDIGLPDMDGAEVLGQLRAGGSKFPVVVLSAPDSATEHNRARGGAPETYLAKPFRFADVLAEVRAQLGTGT